MLRFWVALQGRIVSAGKISSGFCILLSVNLNFIQDGRLLPRILFIPIAAVPSLRIIAAWISLNGVLM